MAPAVDGDSGYVSNSVRNQVADNPVVVFARNGCCMCHVIRHLLHGHGVSPVILDVDEGNEADLIRLLGTVEPAGEPRLPVVFVGGERFGGLDEVMGAHISGELVPRLIAARALWL